jgi:cytochrome P450
MSILNALDQKDHSRFRKAMELVFTERAVRGQEVIIQRYTSALISQLRKPAEGGTVVDIVHWYGFTIFDLIGDLGFGESFNCLQSKEFHPWVEMIFKSLRAATLKSSLRYYPRLDWLLGLAIPKSVMMKKMEHWSLAVDKVNRRLNLEKDRMDLIGGIRRDDEGKEGLRLVEIQATASVIIVAGSETTVTVLSGTTSYLVKNAEKLGALTKEVRERFENESDITLAALKELPYLNAVIQEGLRLCNPT